MTDLFDAAIAARERRIAKLERELTDARAEAERLRAEISERSADVIVSGGRVAFFPSVRRVDYIDRAVDQINALTSQKARDSVLRQRIDDTIARLIRKGIPEEAATRDAAELEKAIRSRTGMLADTGGRSA